MSGYFVDWNGKVRPVADPGPGYVCEVDEAARYVAVELGKMRGRGHVVHEGSWFASLEAIAAAGIKVVAADPLEDPPPDGH
jgi:hypothetical protein